MIQNFNSKIHWHPPMKGFCFQLLKEDLIKVGFETFNKQRDTYFNDQ